MPQDRKRKAASSRDDEKEEPEKDGWRAWARDILVAVIIMVVVLGGIYAYTGNWPPLVVVESSSMQHSDTTSYVGVIDTGDLVFVQTAPARGNVVTYLEGRASGYQTYGDYGDVIVFRLERQPAATPIIHRAIMFVTPDGRGGADVPALANLPPTEWWGVNTQGLGTHDPYGLSQVTIAEMGFNHDLNITFGLTYFLSEFPGESGYITMGDHNAYTSCLRSNPCAPQTPYDPGWFPRQIDIIGRAQGEIPWFGLIKLLASPAGFCCAYWGDPAAPANSWTNLAIAIGVLIALPFLFEAGAWAWSKYAWPWIKPRLRRKKVETGVRVAEVPDGEEPGDDGGGDEPRGD